MRKITVYGSLLEGLGNWHGFLNNSESIKLGEHILEDNLVMISFGGFPGLLVDDKVTNKIFVETYEVSDKVFKSVERLEGYPSFYTRRAIITPFGESEIYVLANAHGRYTSATNALVPKGEDDIINWKTFRTITLRRYED